MDMRMKNVFHRLFAMMLCMMLLMPVTCANAAAHTTVNLNDGEYTYGRFDNDGNPYDKDKPIESGFRSANYLPVEGGRAITIYYETAEWNDQNAGLPFYVVEYDLGKNVINPRGKLAPYYSANRYSLNLTSRTAYIRIWFSLWDRAIETPLDQIDIGVYYLDQYIHEYVPYVKEEVNIEDMYYLDPLYGKHIVYDGDGMVESRLTTQNNGGAYPKLIADMTHGTYTNYASLDAKLSGTSQVHSVVRNLSNLPSDADLYVFQAGINDYYDGVPLGSLSNGYSDLVNEKTLIGAMETIFRYCLDNFPGKPVCFVITHKVRTTAIRPNTSGNTFQDYHDAMVEVCNKYSIPYYDAYLSSGLNGWNATQSNYFLTSSIDGGGDGTHPNEEGYLRYYVPQLLSLFRTMLAK